MNTNERKTININPDLFKINGGNNTTRRQKKENINPNKIKVRENNEKKPKKISTIKRNILKMIRNQQIEKKKKNIHIVPDENSSLKVNDLKIKTDYQNDFNDTLEYLSTLTKDTDEKVKTQTIRRYPQTITDLQNTIKPKPNVDVFEISNEKEPPMILNPTPLSLPPPKYGCLKHGSLPTYRTWINQTRKAPNPPSLTNVQQNYEKKLEENIKELSRIQQKNKIETFQSNNIVKKHYKIPKQKRIIRRTYYVGRSKVFPKISVLVANKTIRANTQLKTQHLKQIPMTEVKNYLLKHGFIKIGTNSPNDVLREMYENVQMICGEVKNHNPENLLYNYFNDNSHV